MPHDQKSPTHLSAAIGSLTERGKGNARTSSGLTVAGPAVACASNVVAYEDGRAAAIADGSTAWIVGGFDLADYGDFKRLASVGIELDSGDVIFHVPERERLASGSWLRVVKQPGAMRRGEVA
ncbi:hypothetical protein L2Y90_20360 [Burkholderia pyrrocinia]|uniref:hypothetical protein n=1 Tax=Burkholderia pyrrocinia TaxID=60550 RepID=UPI00215ABC70|nr:hypothetical protein [Burkholderia pyrrocinia]UVE69109.1 hypothetical protein L2Y90_20360 [Burkholderia pyrrocinia]